MNSRENFLKTVNHQQPNKLVVDFGSTPVTGMHALTIEKLRSYYGLKYKPIRIIEPFQMLGEIDDDLREIIGVDVIGILGKENMFGFDNNSPFKEFQTFWGQTVLVPKDFNTKVNNNGDLLMFPKGDIRDSASAIMPKSGFFFDAIIRQEKIVEDELDPKDNLEEFSLVSEDELEYWRISTTNARKTGNAVIATLGGTALGDIALVPGMQLKNPKGIRDVSEWYMSTIMRPDYIKTVFDKQIEIAIENFKRYYSVIGDNIDAVFICGTDFGTQNSTFCAPEQFEEMWLPYYKKINDWIHLHTKWKTFKHSCGAVKSFIPKFIEAGFDIINPVQINARGMDPAQLKKEFGEEIVFWGGGIDTQKTLPYANPEEVRNEIIRLVDTLAKDGGFVFNTVHNVQANVPIENLVAMFETLNEIK